MKKGAKGEIFCSSKEQSFQGFRPHNLFSVWKSLHTTSCQLLERELMVLHHLKKLAYSPDIHVHLQ